MFTDGTFPYYVYPSMSSGSWNVGDYLPRRNMEDYEPESYQPRVYNIPINVETPEGLVPLSRSTSHYPGSSSQFHSNSDHDNKSNEDYHEPDRIGETVTRQRPGPSPIPPPKPKFKTSQGYARQPSHHSRANQHPRVHNIPIQIEKGFNSQETVFPNKDSSQNVPECEKRISVDPVEDSPRSESRQPGEPMNTDKNVDESRQQTNPMGEARKAGDPLGLIKSIQEESNKLASEVNEFDGENLKQYRYLDEMLTRCLLKLDNIDSEGREDVRSLRKSTISHVDRVLAILESKFQKSNESQTDQEATQVESNAEQSPDVGSSMEAESVEADSTQQSESVDHTNTEMSQVAESEQSNEAQMDVEGNLNASEEMTSTQSNKDQDGNVGEPIENPDSSQVVERSNSVDDKLGNEKEESHNEGSEEERLEELPTKINRLDEDAEKVAEIQSTETDH